MSNEKGYIPAEILSRTPATARHTATSASIDLVADDKRCRYWAKVIPAGTDLPMPADIDGAASIPGSYKKGYYELFPGDFAITGEENHHRRQRGWSFYIAYCDVDGEVAWVSVDAADQKSAIKEARCDKVLLKGSGPQAAAIRLIHAIREGLVVAA